MSTKLRVNHLVILLIVILTSVCSASSTKLTQPADPWKIVIAPKDEPGERLVVSGTVYQADGKTPLEGASVYVYHTDTRGFYSGETTNNSNPRLHGTMRTNAQGKYEFETIKPGPYPSARVPAHIHYVVNAPGYKEKIFEIVFEGDVFIDERMREDARSEDSIFSIRPLGKTKEGILSCVQDIKMRHTGTAGVPPAPSADRRELVTTSTVGDVRLALRARRAGETPALRLKSLSG